VSAVSKILPWTAKPLSDAAKNAKFRAVMDLAAERVILGRSAIVTGWAIGGVGVACFAGWFGVLIGGCCCQLMALAVIQLMSGTELTMIKTLLGPPGETNSLALLWGLGQCGMLLSLSTLVVKKSRSFRRRLLAASTTARPVFRPRPSGRPRRLRAQRPAARHVEHAGRRPVRRGSRVGIPARYRDGGQRQKHGANHDGRDVQDGSYHVDAVSKNERN
jgi:hypothetical protein